jgi:hypothetical protein
MMKWFGRASVALAAILVLLLVLPTAAVLADGGGDGTSPCVGSLPTRLSVGMMGRVAQRFSSVRSSPGGPVIAVKYAGAQFEVLEGPVCGNSLTHYRVEYDDGVTGWASESQIYTYYYGNNQYWLEPVPSGLADGQGGGTGGTTTTVTTEEVIGSAEVVPADTTCWGSLTPRLAVGDTGRVARSFSSLRTVPAGNVIQVMYSGDQFTVLEGPVCAGYGTLAWYRLDYGNGLTGWASESERYSMWGTNLYYLEQVN